MDIIFKKNNLKGNLNVISSKSLSHRAIICACLSNGLSIIENVYYSLDVIKTIDCMKNLGCSIKKLGNKLIINGNGKLKYIDILDAYESGSTLRFLIPIALLTGSNVSFLLKEGLKKRPLDVYFELFKKMDISYEFDKENPLKLNLSGKLKSGTYHINGNSSSQFVSGLLMALPLLKDDSKIIIDGKLESIAYVDLTIDIMKLFGVNIINHDYHEFIIFGNQKYVSNNYYVESDYSQAAFFIGANVLGSDIKLYGLNENSKQADKYILDIIKNMGVRYVFDEYLKISKNNILSPTVIDLKNSPDIGPILTVLSAFIPGKTEIINAHRLRLKESDRIKSIVTELKKIGVDILEKEDGIIINGDDKKSYNKAVLDSWNDHRIAMALSILSTKIDGIMIKNFECINKSYPNYLDDFKSVGGEYEIRN